MNLLILLSILITFANCQNVIPERFKNAKNIRKHPQMQEFYENKKEKIQPLIVGGDLGRVPHHVLIFGVNGWDNYIFGGALIHYRWVLTAAHCLAIPFEVVYTLIGMKDNFGTWTSFMEINLSDLILHPNYNADDLNNDIGLIRQTIADSSLLSLPYIATIDLPTPDQVNNTNLIGLNGTVSGFGKVSDNTTTDLLRYVSLPIVDNSVCTNIYGANAIRDTNICVSTTESASTCENDDGGPLSVLLNNSTVLVGILSFNPLEGCELGYPVLFTKISSYLDWIIGYMNEEVTTTTTTTTEQANTTITTTEQPNTTITTTTPDLCTTITSTTTQQSTTPGTASKIIAVNTILLILIQFLLKA